MTLMQEETGVMKKFCEITSQIVITSGFYRAGSLGNIYSLVLDLHDHIFD